MVEKIVGKILTFSTGRYAANLPEGLKEFHNSFRELTDIGYMVSSCKIVDVQTKGKLMYWTFDNGWYMLCTFGMTGQWSATGEKHACLSVRLYDIDSKKDVSVYFNDPRHFGTIKFIKGLDSLNKKLDSLGPDMLSASPSVLIFTKIIINQKNKTIAEVLMNQKYISGVGNYVKAEALYRAGISPWHKCSLLTPDKIVKLRDSIIAVLQESYQAQGATLATYKTVSGEKGSFAEKFRVYGKDKDPLGNQVISEETPDKRTSWWVPSIQK